MLYERAAQAVGVERREVEASESDKLPDEAEFLPFVLDWSKAQNGSFWGEIESRGALRRSCAQERGERIHLGGLGPRAEGHGSAVVIAGQTRA